MGPRVLGDIEASRYESRLEQVHSVPAGITGLWQAQGRHDVSFDRRVELDLEYVEEWSVLRDFKILLRTIPAGMFGTGAN